MKQVTVKNGSSRSPQGERGLKPKGVEIDIAEKGVAPRKGSVG